MFTFLRKIFWSEWEAIVIISIVSFFLVAELFLLKAQPQTFDGWTHLVTINRFHSALSEGSFPVSWVDGTANYGFPIGQVAQQTTAYIGAFFLSFTHSTLLAFNLTLLLGVLLSCFAFYFFLRLHVSLWPAVAATVLFNFAPYRITNIYVRGDLPEIFAVTFIPIILIGIHQLFAKKSWWGGVTICIGTALLVLTHPMMLVIGGTIIVFYFVYYLLQLQTLPEKVRVTIVGTVAVMLAVAIASYYLLPLFLEIKYFYYGQQTQILPNLEFLSAQNYLQEIWNYQDKVFLGIRENRLQAGSIETGVVIFSAVWMGWKTLQKRTAQLSTTPLFYYLLLGVVVSVLLTTEAARALYEHISLFTNMQYPWRFLTAFTFFAATILALLLQRLHFKKNASILLILIICLLRFPQLYGKNYVQYPESRYQFSIVNLHSTNMNPIWTGVSWDYPVKAQKYAIIDGIGTVGTAHIQNTRRIYQVTATTPLRMVDYTFYFPGWQLFIDKQPASIEFQDLNYRGVITYIVPQGQHVVTLQYTDTKVRLLGKIISGVGSMLLVFFTAVILTQKNSRKIKVLSWYIVL